MENYCIYYKSSELKFKKREHIIPAGMGGTLKLPAGYVSDQANELFSPIELKAMRSTMIASVRNYIGPGHRGNTSVSKKLKPRMQILKLNKKYVSLSHENVHYRIGFTMNKKTVFLPQVFIKVDSCGKVIDSLYTVGEFDNDCNQFLRFEQELMNVAKNNDSNVQVVSTTFQLPFLCIILGVFYGQWYIYYNIPLMTLKQIMNMVIGRKWKERINFVTVAGGEYDFSYDVTEGFWDNSLGFLYVKTAFNVLAYVMKQEFVLDARLDYVRNKILNNDTMDLLDPNVDAKIINWINTNVDEDMHAVLLLSENCKINAYVTFYKGQIYKILLMNDYDGDLLRFSYISNWKNKTDNLITDIDI